MKGHIFSILLLILTVHTGCSTIAERFFISAPAVFHMGVKEKVFIQMERADLNELVTLYLEHESTGIVVSKKETISCADETDIKTVELMIDSNIMSRINPPPPGQQTNLLVVAQILGKRNSTRVLVSQHRGHIFIQTDQPMYNPTQTVKYRIFALDQTLRPLDDILHISVFNAAGNRVMKSLKQANGGIYSGTFTIPDVSKMGTWNITAHYEDDKAHAAFREFKVQKFVLPTFEVSITMDQNYILLNDEWLNFTISAMYSYGEKVKGAYHCQFGVVKKGTTNPDFIKGLELTGSVEHGTAKASHTMAKIMQHIQDQWSKTLNDLQQSGAQLYLGVFFTNIQSGEIQEGEVFLPIIPNRYTMDLSRTRSYYVPGFPLDVVVYLCNPDGSPAADVPVKIDVGDSTEKSWEGTTDSEGAMVSVFNMHRTTGDITVEVFADDLEKRKVIQHFSSPHGSYLYMGFTNRIYSVNEVLSVTYNTNNAPDNGNIYYMVLSRGVIIKTNFVPLGKSVKSNLKITADMVPSFRLIGYFYSQNGDIIADSMWVDVRDECEITVKVDPKAPFTPGKGATLEFDLHGESAKVALLAVDKAFYALKADNKLTAKQVFSSMQSYDLGCSYGGGSNPASVLTDAGLSFVSQSSSVTGRRDFVCHSQSERQRRSVDLQQEIMSLKSNFSDKTLQECCVRGFSLIPMKRTCEERAKRVSQVEPNSVCADVFLKCCLEGERLRQKKMEEDALKQLGRTVSIAEIEQLFFDSTAQYIRRFFPPSFEFKEFEVNNKKKYYLPLPDSITTWEIQVVTLSPTTGFCVVKPSEVKAFKKAFVSLRLPYSVKKYEQLSISPVIYNYGDRPLQVAVHMEQTEGLCSPGSASTSAFVNITVKERSSQLVSFSAVPMVTGSIPIKIRLYDMEEGEGIDALEKLLNVLTEGVERKEEATKVIKLNARSTNTITIDGTLPDEMVPDSGSNIFISVEEDGYSISHVRSHLSAKKVVDLIILPHGCLEQTMSRMGPTVVALRYLDLSQQWFHLPPGSRDDALDKIEIGYVRVKGFRKGSLSYGPWYSVKSSNWVTALAVKFLSLLAERQIVAVGQQGRSARVVAYEEIREPVQYLLSVQNNDGSFSDPQPVLHKGILKGNDQDASMTAFITLALHRSLDFLEADMRKDADARILRSTTYLISHFEELQHPYAVAITAYCLSVCPSEGANLTAVWTKLKNKATTGLNGCYLWTTDVSKSNQEKANAITIETTAYALLTAVALGHTEWADKTACWLTTQENYMGGYRSSQDTVMALEALSEYELKRFHSPAANLIAEFSVPGKSNIVKLALENKERVEADLRKFVGNNILVTMTGQGNIKFKVMKVYHLLQPNDNCGQLSISVRVDGKVKYTAKVIENYDYYDDDDVNEEKDTRVPRSAIEWFDARTRNRRDVDIVNSDNTVTYTVCVSLTSNLTGMAIADITLLSGFEAVEEDLDMLKKEPELYISHYEISDGKVLLYFNELFEPKECISFDAVQRVPIGLLQPAPAVFYDYYEPNRKCTVFYSAPKRSKMVSKLCSEDVCQCAERPCHKVQTILKGLKNQRITKNDRGEHACFSPTVDYAYIVQVLNISMKSNFDLYSTNVNEVLRSKGDVLVTEDSVRVFAKRRQCKGQLDLGKEYLIMGKDGSTTDSTGVMQYLLESNTWVEKKECEQGSIKPVCRSFNEFISEYKLDGCKQ
ncbi:complement C4-B isoform X1 [Scomber scombrus]|uniref:Complement C4-B isoform X1 n=1 Tax=Scomber scombrus TaxID=13677 RepID=A0AAV1NMR9_SCOSC